MSGLAIGEHRNQKGIKGAISIVINRSKPNSRKPGSIDAGSFEISVRNLVILFCLFGANVFKGDALFHQALSQVAGSK